MRGRSARSRHPRSAAYRCGSSRCIGLLAAATAGVAALPSASLAHVDNHPAESAWWAWQFTPDIVIATTIVATLYAAGLYRLKGRGASPSGWRNVSFFAGLSLILLALQSPLDALSEHSFAIHQIQHLLLHSAGPMLIMLAAPQGPLAAGFPVALRRYVLGPVTTNKALRAVFGFLSRPAAATSLFVGSLYFWQLATYHDLAVLDDAVHYSMHVSMLVAGLLFFWCVLDPRPEPWGAPSQTRMIVVWTALASNILLGAFTTFKESALYSAYDELGRLWGLAPLTDEQLGGLVIWIPGSMMYVVVALVVIRVWGSHEAKVDERRRRGLVRSDAPTHGSPRSASGRPGDVAADNRALALKLATVAAVVFAIVIGIGVLVVTRVDPTRPLLRDDVGQHTAKGAAGPTARRESGASSPAVSRIRSHHVPTH